MLEKIRNEAMEQRANDGGLTAHALDVIDMTYIAEDFLKEKDAIGTLKYIAPGEITEDMTKEEILDLSWRGVFTNTSAGMAEIVSVLYYWAIKELKNEKVLHAS